MEGYKNKINILFNLHGQHVAQWLAMLPLSRKAWVQIQLGVFSGGVYMLSLCLHRFSPGTPGSSHSQKHVGKVGPMCGCVSNLQSL